MNFKDKTYYRNKLKNYLGIALTALALDALLVVCLWLA